MGVVTARTLAKNRKYAILGAFVAGAVLTPTPDAFNQALMAGPLILLYEVGIICARLFGRRPQPGGARVGRPSDGRSMDFDCARSARSGPARASARRAS